MTSNQAHVSRPKTLSGKAFGLRVLLSLILLCGCGLGWLVHTAHVQHEAVATIKRLGGQCRYDWEAQNRQRTPVALPTWRRWLIGTLGPDYICSVTQAHIGFPTTQIKPTMDDLASIGRLSRLEHLSLGNLTSARQALTHVRNLRRLKHLDLFEDGGNAGGDLAGLANLTQLEELQISVLSLSDADLANVSSLINLKHLSLSTPTSQIPAGKDFITDEGLVALEPLQNLQTLQISGNNRITNAGLSHIGRLTRLDTLTIQGDRLTSVAPLRRLVGLRSLTIGRTGFTDSGIDDAGATSFADFPNLSSVVLMGSRSFTNAGLTHLRALPNLASLNLSGSAVDDVGVASLVEFPKLKHIVLSFTSVTDIGLAALAKRPGYSSIDVGFTKVSPEGASAARVALPGTRINHQVFPGTGITLNYTK